MITGYNNNPLVEKVIVLIGPKEREGITREQSMEIFKLYGVTSLEKVSVEQTKFDNPMVAGFDFIEKDPRALEYTGFTFGFGSSDKGDDAARAARLVDYFSKNPEKLRPNLNVGYPPVIKALKEDGASVSATNLREAIRNRDLQTISRLIPNNVNPKDFLNIFNK